MKPSLQNITSFIASINIEELNGNNSHPLFSLATSVGNIDYNILLANARRSQSKYLFWAKPSEEFYALGFDTLLQLEFTNEQTHSEQLSILDELKNNFVNNWTELNLETVPVVMGGRKFQEEAENIVWQDYTSSDWFIPNIVFLSIHGKHFLVLNFFYDENFKIEHLEKKINSLLVENRESNKEEVTISYQRASHDDYEEWVSSINAALADITGSKLNKIVLSREVTFDLSRNPDLPLLMESLGNKYPECYTFAFRSGESIFFGASPEKLIKVTNNYFEIDALAGSIKRGISKSEDESLANSLLASKKNLVEHKVVVDFILNAITKNSQQVLCDKSPRIKKLENIQHLRTPITGKVKENISIFSIINDLHPTPAVCGVPCKNAMKFIRLHEKHKRGLYSGVIGWFNFNNEAEFAVGIRSALIKGNKLYAYSGCGIVEGSNPESEFEESELKLKPILTLFKNENSY